AKALAKQPEERYGRVGELLFDYRAALAGQALQFSSSGEQTQRAHLYLDSTQRAMNPPVAPAGPGWAGSGPATPPFQPVAQPAPPPGYYTTAMPGSATPAAPLPSGPERLKLWTPGFTGLFVVVALLGAVVTIVLDVRVGSIDDFTNSSNYASI